MGLLEDIAQGKALDLQAKQSQENLDKAKKEYDTSLENQKANLDISQDSIERNTAYKKKLLNIQSGFEKDKAQHRYEQDLKRADIEYKYDILSALYKDSGKKEYEGSPGDILYQSKKDQTNDKAVTALLNRGKKKELAKATLEGSLKGIQLGQNEAAVKLEAERKKLYDDLMIPYSIQIQSRLSSQERERQMTIDIAKQNMDLRFAFTSEILGMVTNDLIEAESTYGDSYIFGRGGALEGAIQGGAHLVDTSLDSLEWMGESFFSLVSGNGLAKYDGNKNFERFIRKLGFNGENVGDAGREYFSIYDRMGLSYLLNKTAYSLPEMLMLGFGISSPIMKGFSYLKAPNINMLQQVNQNFIRAIDAARKAGNADKVLILENIQKSVLSEMGKRIPRRQLTGYINSLVYKSAEAFLTKYPHLKNEIANLLANPSLAKSLVGFGSGGKMILSGKDIRNISSLVRQAGRAVSTPNSKGLYYLGFGLASLSQELGRRVHMQMEQRGQDATFTWMDLFGGLNHLLVDLAGATATLAGLSKLANKPLFGSGSFGLTTPLEGVGGFVGGMGLEGIGEILQTYWELSAAANYNFPPIDEIMRNPAKFHKENMAFQESFVIGALASGLISAPARVINKIGNGVAELQLKRQQERLRELLEEQNSQITGIMDQAYDAQTDYASAQENLQSAYSTMSDSAKEAHQNNTKSMYEEAAQAQAQAQAVIDKHINSQKNQANQSTTSQQSNTTQQDASTQPKTNPDIVVSRSNSAAQYALQQELVAKQEKLAEMRKQAAANANTLTAEEAQQMADLESDIAEIQEAITNLDIVDSMYHKDTLNQMIAEELKDNTDQVKEKSLLDLQSKIVNAKSQEDLQEVMEEIKQNPFIQFNKKDLEDLNKFYRKDERKKNKFSTNARFDELNEDESYQNLDGSTDGVVDASNDANTTTKQGQHSSSTNPDPNQTQTQSQTTPDPTTASANTNASSTTSQDTSTDDDVDEDLDEDAEEVDRSKSLEDAIKEAEKHEKAGHNEAVRKVVKDIFNTLSFEEQMYLLAKKYNSKQAEKLLQDYVLVRVRNVTALNQSPVSPTSAKKSSRSNKTSLTNDNYHYIWVRRYFNDIDLESNPESLTDMIETAYRRVSSKGLVSLTNKFKSISTLIRDISDAKLKGQDTAQLEQDLDTAIIEVQNLVVEYTQDVKDLLELYNFLFKNTSDFDLKRIIANNIEVIKTDFLDSVKEFKDIKKEIENIKSNNEPLTENFFHKLKTQIKTKVFSNLFDYARALIDNPKNPNKASKLQQAFNEIERFVEKVETIFEDANGELYRLSQLMDKSVEKMKFHLDNYFKTEFENNNTIEIGLTSIDTGQPMSIKFGQTGQNVLDNLLSFVRLLTNGLGFTRSYHKQVARTIVRAMNTFSTKFEPLPKEILGFAEMFNTKDDIVPYIYKQDSHRYSITLKELITRRVDVSKLPKEIQDNLKSVNTEQERLNIVNKFLNEVFFNKNKPALKDIVEQKIETRLAKLEPLFQAGLVGYANAIVNSTQFNDIKKRETFKVFTPESIRESMWKTAKDILDIKNITDSEAEMLKGIMWTYVSTYFGDMRLNQDLSQGKDGNRVVGQLNYNTLPGESNQKKRQEQDAVLNGFDKLYPNEVIDKITEDKDLFQRQGQGLIVVNNILIQHLKDNFQDNFDSLQNRSNLAKISNNMSSRLGNVYRAIKAKFAKGKISWKDMLHLHANSFVKYSINPDSIIFHLARSLGISLSNKTMADLYNEISKEKKRITHKHYQELQAKFKNDVVTKQTLDEMRDILTNPARAEENPFNYVPVLVRNQQTGQLEFQYFYYENLSTQNADYCKHIGFDINEISIGESMENYMDKVYTQLREVGSLMSALNNAIHHKNKGPDGAEFDYSSPGNEVNFLKGVYFMTAIQGSSGRIHYDHPLFSPTSNKWVQDAFDKQRRYSKSLVDRANTPFAEDGEYKKGSKYYKDLLSKTDDPEVILSMEIAFSDIFNIDVDKYKPTRLFNNLASSFRKVADAFQKGKIGLTEYNNRVHNLRKKYNKALVEGKLYTRSTTEYNDILNKYPQIAKDYCEVDSNGNIVSLDTSKLFHAFRKRENNAILLFRVLYLNYKAGSIPKDSVFRKLRHLDKFNSFAKGNELNVWNISTYIDGSSTTLGESGLTIQYYDAQKAILKMGNINTDAYAATRDILNAYDTLVREGIMPEVPEMKGPNKKVDGYTGVLATIKAQLSKIKGYSVYANLLLGSGILTRDAAKNIVTPVSYQSKPVNAFKAKDSKIDAAMRQMISRFTTTHLVTLLEKVRNEVKNDPNMISSLTGRTIINKLKKEIQDKLNDYQARANSLTEVEAQEYALYELVYNVWFSQPAKITQGASLGKIVDRGGLFVDFEAYKLEDYNRKVRGVLGGLTDTEFDYAKINNALLSYLEADRQNLMTFNQVTSIETEEFQEAMSNKSTAMPLMRAILALADYIINPTDRISNTQKKHTSKVDFKSRTVISTILPHLTKDMFDNYTTFFEVDRKTGRFTDVRATIQDRFNKVAKSLDLNSTEADIAKQHLLNFLSGYYSIYKATNQMVFNTKSSLNKQLALHSTLINQSHNTSTSWNILTSNQYQEWMSFLDSVYRSFIEKEHIKNPNANLLDNKGNIDSKAVDEYRKKNPHFNYELESTMKHTFNRLIDRLTERIFVNNLMQVLPSLSSLSQVEQKRIKQLLMSKNINNEERLKLLVGLSQEKGWGLLEEGLTKLQEVYTAGRTFSYTNWRTTFANVMPLINHSLEALVTQRIVLENSLLKQVYDSMEQYAPLTIKSLRYWNSLFIQYVNQMKLSHSDVLLNIEKALTTQLEEVRKELHDLGKIDADRSRTLHNQNMKLNNKRNKQKLAFLRSLFPIAANAIKEFTTKFGNINFIDSFDEQFLANSLPQDEKDKLDSGGYGNAKHIYNDRIERLIKETLLILESNKSLSSDFLFDEMNEYVDINGNVYVNPLKPVLDFYKRNIESNNISVNDYFSNPNNKSEIDNLIDGLSNSLNFIDRNPLDLVADTRLTPKDVNKPTIPLDENPFGDIDTSNVVSPNQAASQAIIDVALGQTSSGTTITAPELNVDVDTDEVTSADTSVVQWRIFDVIKDKFSSFGDMLSKFRKVFKNSIMYAKDGVIDAESHGRELGNINPLKWGININSLDMDTFYDYLGFPPVDTVDNREFKEKIGRGEIKTIRELHIENIKRMLINHLKDENLVDESVLIPDLANESATVKETALKERKAELRKVIDNIEKYPNILHTIKDGKFTFEIKAIELNNFDQNTQKKYHLKDINGITIEFAPKEFLGKTFVANFIDLYDALLKAEKVANPTKPENRHFSNQLINAIESLEALMLAPNITARDTAGNLNLVVTPPKGHIPTPLESIKIVRGRGTRYVSLHGEGVIYKLYEELIKEYNIIYNENIGIRTDESQLSTDEISNRLPRLAPVKKVNTQIKDRQDKQEVQKTQTNTQTNPQPSSTTSTNSSSVKKKSSAVEEVKRESISIARQHPNSSGQTTSVKRHLTNRKASMQRLRADLRNDRNSLTTEEKDIEEVFDFAEDNLGLIEDTTEYIVSNASSKDSGYTEVYDYTMDDSGNINPSTETSIVVFPNNRNFDKFTRLHETIHALTMIAMSHPATKTLVASLNSIFNQVREYLLTHPDEMEKLLGGHPNFTAKERFDYIFNTNRDDNTNPYRRQAEFLATFLSEPKLFRFLKSFNLESNYANLSSNTLVGKAGNLVRRILEAIGNAIFRIFTGSSLNVTNAGAETLHIARMLSNFSSFNTVERREAQRLMSGVESLENTLQDGIVKPLFHMATLGIFKSIGARIKDGTLTQDEVDAAKADVKFSLRSKDINMQNVVSYLRNPDVPKIAKYAMVTTLVISHTLQLGKNMLNKPAVRSAFIDLYVRNMQILTEGTIFDIQVFQDLGLYRGESFMKKYNSLMEDVAGKNQYIIANSERFAKQLKDYSLKLIRDSRLVKSLNMTDKEIEELDTHLGNIVWKLGLGDSVREGINFKEYGETIQQTLNEMTSHLLGYKSGPRRYSDIISYTATEMTKYFKDYLEDLEKEGHITGIKVTKKDREKIFNFINRATHDLALQRVQGYSYSDMGFTNAEQVIDSALKAFMLDKANSNKSKAIRDRIENHIRYGKTSIMSNKHIANSIRQVSILKAIEVLKTNPIYDMNKSIKYFIGIKKKLEAKGLKGHILEELLHSLSRERNAILDVTRKELQLDYKKAFEYIKKGYKLSDKRIQDKIYTLQSRFGDSVKGFHHYDSYTPYTFNPDVSIVKLYKSNEKYAEQKEQLERLGYTKFYDFVIGEIYKYDGVINYNQTTNNYGFIHNNDAPLGNISGLIQNDFEDKALELDDIKSQTQDWGKSVLADYYNNSMLLNNYIQNAIDIRFNSADTTITRVANSLVKFRAVLPREIYEEATQQKVSMSEFMFNATKEAFVKQKRQTINNLTYISVLAQQKELQNREFGHHTAILGEVQDVYNEYTGRNEKRFFWNKDTLEKYGITLNNDDAREFHNLTEMYQQHNEVGDKILIDTRLITYYFGFKPLNLLELVSPSTKEVAASPTIIKAVGWFQTILKKWIKEVRKNTIILNPNLTTQNFLSNFMGLVMYRIPFKKIMYDGFKYARELELFLELQSQEAEVVKNLHKQRKGSIKYYEALNKVNHIRKSIEANPIYPLYKEGLYTNLVEDMDERNQIDRGVVKFINKMINKKDNPTIAAWIEEGLLTNKSDTYNMLARWNRYGDFIPRVILYYYEREQGTDHRQAIRLARETFVDYTLPLHSDVFRNLDAFGMINYAKYKFRVQRVILKNFRESPLRAFGLIATNELTGINSMSAWLYENILQDGLSSGIVGGLGNMAKNSIRYNTITNFPKL